MKRIALAALSGMAIATFLSQRNRGTRQASDRTEQDIRNVMNQIRVAQLNGDASALETTLADDYTFTNPFGEVMTKEQVVSDLRSGIIKFEAFDVDDVHLRAYGNSAVIVTGIVRLKAQRYGHDISGDLQGTWFWVKNRGRWEPVAGQVTRIGHPAMAGSAPARAGARAGVES